MGPAVLFPKFLRKLQCIGRSHKKQNRCPMPPLEYIQTCTAHQMCLKYSTSINSLLTTDRYLRTTNSFRGPVNKRFVFGGASINGSFSEARQQTVRFRWRLN